MGKAGSQHVSCRTANSRQRVFVEVSRLLDPALVHTGIARYGRELLRHLPLVSDDDVWAVVQQPQSGWTKRSEAATSDLLELVQGQLIGVEAHCSFAKALSTFEPLATHDVFHSIHLPLPPATSTGSAGRVLTVHDVLHLRRPDLYNSIGVPPIQRSIDSLLKMTSLCATQARPGPTS